MGEAAGPTASMASVGLTAYSTYLGASGKKAANDFQADSLEKAAKYGDLKATQTGAQMTQKLNMTLGNIDAMRAASHTDPTSPSGVAYRELQQEVGDTQKSITTGNIRADARQKEADAAYLRYAGNQAMLGGYISIAGQILGAGGSSMGKTGNSFGVDGL